MTRTEIKHQLYLLKRKLDKRFDSTIADQIQELEKQLKRATVASSDL